jgi:hypothetical protein
MSDTLTIGEQNDMRGLLDPILAYLKEVNPAFSDAEVVVTDKIAAIDVPTGLVPNEKSSEASENQLSKLRCGIVSTFEKFFRESCRTSSPLMQYTVHLEGKIRAIYRVYPNDILGAEKELTKLLDRLRRHKE